MFELRRIAVINWYLIGVKDIDLTANAGVIGENRSGKSSLLDAVQTVMTGNNGNYNRLNASAQDDGKKRSKRSVKDYCLGRIAPGQAPERKSCRTYLALGFERPEDGKKATIGLCLEARENADEGETVVARFIAPGVFLSVDSFVDRGPKGERIAKDWKAVRPALEAACRAAGGELKVSTSSESFVSDYLRLLSTGNRFIDARQFMKAFANAVSYEAIPSATAFVRDYVLEKKDIRIAQLRQSIQTYREIHAKILDLRDQLASLKDIAALIAKYEGLVDRYVLECWIKARAQLDMQLHAYVTMLRQKRDGLKVQSEATGRLTDIDAEIKKLESDKSALITLIAQSDQAMRRELLKKNVAAAERERKDALKPIEDARSAIAKAVVAAEDRAIFPGGFADSAKVLDELKATLTETGASWPKDPARVDALIEDLTHLPRLKAEVENAGIGLIQRQGVVGAEATARKKELQLLRTRGAAISETTAILQDELAEKGFKPRLLCELVEVADPDWRDAAEALLGRDREAIIVPPSQAQAAIQHLRENRRRFHGCRVANTAKEDYKHQDCPADSLAAVLETSDPLARIYVNRRLGTARRVERREELSRRGRAIMRDCTYDDGLAVETRRVEGGYKLGASIRQTAEADLIKKIAELEAEDRRLVSEAARHDRVAKALVGLIELIENKTSVLRLAKAFKEIDRDWREQSEELAAMGKGGDDKQQARLAEMEALLKAKQDERGRELKRQIEAGSRVSQATQILTSGEQQLGSRFAVKMALKGFIRERGQYAMMSAWDAYEHRLKNKKNDPASLHAQAAGDREELKGKMSEAQSEVFDRLVDHRRRWSEGPSFDRQTSGVSKDVKPWVTTAIQDIEGNRLIGFEQQARAAEDTARKIFQTDFVASLNERIGSIKRSVDTLNKILEPHRFHYERYKFRMKKDALYEDILDFVVQAQSDDKAMMTLLDGEPDPKSPHGKAIAKIREILLDPDADISVFEDYRKYYRFDLVMTDANGHETTLDERVGTGSGAERQVPFYIAIGAALAQAYHGQSSERRDVPRGIGLAMFDEAFSKLDGRNQKACLDFFRSLGLQTVVAAPYDKRASLYEAMDTMIEVFRDGTHVEIDVEYIKEKAHREIAAVNPAQFTLDDIRRLQAARDAGLSAAAGE